MRVFSRVCASLWLMTQVQALLRGNQGMLPDNDAFTDRLISQVTTAAAAAHTHTTVDPQTVSTLRSSSREESSRSSKTAAPQAAVLQAPARAAASQAGNRAHRVPDDEAPAELVPIVADHRFEQNSAHADLQQASAASLQTASAASHLSHSAANAQAAAATPAPAPGGSKAGGGTSDKKEGVPAWLEKPPYWLPTPPEWGPPPSHIYNSWYSPRTIPQVSCMQMGVCRCCCVIHSYTLPPASCWVGRFVC